MECDAGHALNDLFRKFGSVNTGAPAKVQPKIQIFFTYFKRSTKKLEFMIYTVHARPFFSVIQYILN